MKIFSLIGVLLLPLSAWSSPLSVEPQVIAAGEVALLRWQAPAAVGGEVQFNGKTFALQSTSDGAVALLGSDLETAPGTYPVEVRLSGAAGIVETQVRIVRAQRPEERLTLPEAMVSPKDPKVLKRIEQDQALMKKVFAVQSAGTVLTDFRLPVADPMGSPFGLRRILNGKPRSPHAGIDFRSPRGTPVRPSAAGTVAFTGDLYYTGLTVVIDHGGGLLSLYCHLETIDCAEGQRLEGTEVLGTVGSTGRSTGPHLHWGVKLRGDRIDPLTLLALLGGKNA